MTQSLRMSGAWEKPFLLGTDMESFTVILIDICYDTLNLFSTIMGYNKRLIHLHLQVKKYW